MISEKYILIMLVYPVVNVTMLKNVNNTITTIYLK
jgi:hypothetical protein